MRNTCDIGNKDKKIPSWHNVPTLKAVLSRVMAHMLTVIIAM